MLNADSFAQTSWLIPCYPLFGALLSVFWSPAFIRRSGPRPAGYLNLLTTVIALVHSSIAFMAVWHQPAQFLSLSWLQVADLNLTLPLELSSLTLGASIVITVLNFLVQVYTVGYLEMDWGWGRIYSLLALFEAGLTALVLCDSLFFSYILLEILTLGTYLIVGFWFNQSLVVTGARDAFLTKRVGDLILLMGVLALYPLAGTWNFTELADWSQGVLSGAQSVSPLALSLIGVALVAGPISKCAQFPLHLWLDEAMEGPLPTTILRNSVVVATGAWVLVKLEPVIALSPVASGLTLTIGSISAVGGALIAAAQIDAKRVLSYLTSTYMGLIFIAVGTGQTQAALLLVLTHAIASTLLIMSTGSIMLNVVVQDLTQMGGLWSRRPITGLCFLVAVAGLIGLPPFGGFWPLMAMLEGLLQSGQWGLIGIVLLANGAASFALVRMFGLMFMGDRTAFTARAPEPLWLVVLPTAVMAGIVLHVPLIVRNFSLYPVDASLSWTLGWTVFLSSAVGIVSASAFYVLGRIENPTKLIPAVANRLLAYDFYTPKVYQVTAIALVDKLSLLTDWLDRYVVDGLVNFVGLSSLLSGEALKYINTGKLQLYALTIASFVVVICLYLSWGYFSL
ncbi:NAD(P)H dehydrogenase, subunit NdhF3 family [Synechococcus sp. PCC 7335]|uniref:NAD(P)H-quinone oxidoreductase subunit F n=1 Tax=Synechococcus sp. (strain ATCC 29403 / PCC 7335) TaxID=91464 RepID=UPI00017EDFDE|nr:NAD(P)H-quinone oxidoreductase subunit F [Synechococcus sp. PCC 7335]EDX85493.1 NAD(P)H dehydrogenase, subunit NdhF3 family [Synechococcus sp. PCC 7335]